MTSEVSKPSAGAPYLNVTLETGCCACNSLSYGCVDFYGELNKEHTTLLCADIFYLLNQTYIERLAKEIIPVINLGDLTVLRRGKELEGVVILGEAQGKNSNVGREVRGNLGDFV